MSPGSSSCPLSFRESYLSEAWFPRTPLLGDSVNRGKPASSSRRKHSQNHAHQLRTTAPSGGSQSVCTKGSYPLLP